MEISLQVASEKQQKLFNVTMYNIAMEPYV